MTLEDLKKAAAKACEDFRRAEAKAQGLQRKVQAAKARADQARLEHRRPRQSPEQAKRAALAAEEQVRNRLCRWERAQKRLTKALKEFTKAEPHKPKRSASAAAAFAIPPAVVSDCPPPTQQSAAGILSAAMKHTYDRLLNDDELRPHLERGDSLVFNSSAKPWQQIERQVDRLGFGDDYAVSRTSKRGPSGEQHVTRVTPLRRRSDEG